MGNIMETEKKLNMIFGQGNLLKDEEGGFDLQFNQKKYRIKIDFGDEFQVFEFLQLALLSWYEDHIKFLCTETVKSKLKVSFSI